MIEITIYLDVVLLENLCMNYIILFGVSYILKIKKNHLRLIISAFIGGVYAILAYIQIVDIYSNFFMKILLSFVMVYVAYNAKSIKLFFKEIVLFYLTSFVFGGCAFFLLYFIKPQEIFMKDGVLIGTYPIKIAILGGIVGFTVCIIAFNLVKSKIRKKDMFCQIEIVFEDKEVKVKAMIDTGNMLKDPISKMPVIVVEKDILYEVIPYEILDNLENILRGDVKNKNSNLIDNKYLSKFRVIPFSSIGKQNGLLLGFKSDRVNIIFDEEEIKLKDIIIGIYDSKLSKRQNYSALLGLDLLEGSEEYEFTGTIKG